MLRRVIHILCQRTRTRLPVLLHAPRRYIHSQMAANASNGIFVGPPTVNEPVLSYAPGSKERKELQAAYDTLFATPIDAPMFIGGKEVRTGQTSRLVCPHDHKHDIGSFHLGTKEHVVQAIDAALHARKTWATMSWEHRASVFLKVSPLLREYRRQETSHKVLVVLFCSSVNRTSFVFVRESASFFFCLFGWLVCCRLVFALLRASDQRGSLCVIGCRSDGGALPRQDQCGHNDWTVEERVPGRDRLCVRAGGLSAHQREVHAGHLPRPAPFGPRHLEPRRVQRAGGLCAGAPLRFVPQFILIDGKSVYPMRFANILCPFFKHRPCVLYLAAAVAIRLAPARSC
jgi:hypothetical protein